MSTGAVIVVKNRDGRPLAGVPVVPVNASTGAEGTAVNTDAQGLATFTALADATYGFSLRNVKLDQATIFIVSTERPTFTDFTNAPHDHGDADDGGGISGAAITFAAPSFTLGTVNTQGAATTPVPSNSTILAFDATVPTTSAVGDSAATGAAAVAARRDHAHGRESFATNALVLGTAAAAGAATTPMRSNDTIAAFDVTVPTTSAVGDSAATGAAAVAARRDHAHGREAFGSPGASAVGDSASDGVATTLPRSDHKHSREAFATPAIVLGTAAAAGVATTPIRSDSTIVAFDATVPTSSAVGDAASAGAAAVAARRDHTHGREAFATNTIALGTAAAAGAATTLIRSDATIAAFDATVPTTIALADAAATGSAAVAARRDHRHGMFTTITTAAISDYTAPTTWSPGYTNITTTDATITPRYEKIGKRVFGSFTMVFGASSEISGTAGISPPVTASSSLAAGTPIGSAMAWDTSASTMYILIARLVTTTRIEFEWGNVNEKVNATQPFDWTIGDQLFFEFQYEAA